MFVQIKFFVYSHHRTEIDMKIATCLMQTNYQWILIDDNDDA